MNYSSSRWTMEERIRALHPWLYIDPHPNIDRDEGEDEKEDEAERD